MAIFKSRTTRASKQTTTQSDEVMQDTTRIRALQERATLNAKLGIQKSINDIVNENNPLMTYSTYFKFMRFINYYVKRIKIKSDDPVLIDQIEYILKVAFIYGRIAFVKSGEIYTLNVVTKSVRDVQGKIMYIDTISNFFNSFNDQFVMTLNKSETKQSLIEYAAVLEVSEVSAWITIYPILEQLSKFEQQIGGSLLSKSKTMNVRVNEETMADLNRIKATIGQFYSTNGLVISSGTVNGDISIGEIPKSSGSMIEDITSLSLLREYLNENYLNVISNVSFKKERNTPDEIKNEQSMTKTFFDNYVISLQNFLDRCYNLGIFPERIEVELNDHSEETPLEDEENETNDKPLTEVENA